MSSYFKQQLDVIASEHDRSNPSWVQFIKDHTPSILAMSPIKELHVDKLNLYRYRPRSLFKEFDIKGSDAWIVLLINNIPFGNGIPVHVTSIHVPSDSHIYKLKQMYSKYANVAGL